MSARLLLFIGGLVISGATKAGPLSMEPSIGLASEYASNPILNSGQANAQSNEAILMDDPIHYDLDSLRFAVDPSLRYGDSGGYSSLASNYYHLNGSATCLSDLSTLSAKIALARDSSLYQYGLSSNGLGVRTDSISTALDWQRQFTERSSFTVDGGWSRVLYNQQATDSGLDDYRYFSAAATAAYAASERSTLQLSGTAGQYDALDGITASRSFGLQLGLERKLSEIWNLSSSVGYSKSSNSQKIYTGQYVIGSTTYGPYYVGTLHATQHGAVFDAAVARTGETLTVKAHLSRAYRPGGYAFLSREDIADVDLKYLRSDRWTFGSKVTYQNTATPATNSALYTTHFLSTELSAGWNWTPNWLISLTTRWVRVRYDLPPIGAQSTSISMQITRQFLRIDL